MEGEPAHGAVCIDETGSVTGYSGRLLCLDCGEEFDPRAPRLRAVD